MDSMWDRAKNVSLFLGTQKKTEKLKEVTILKVVY